MLAVARLVRPGKLEEPHRRAGCCCIRVKEVSTIGGLVTASEDAPVEVSGLSERRAAAVFRFLQGWSRGREGSSRFLGRCGTIPVPRVVVVVVVRDDQVLQDDCSGRGEFSFGCR